MHRHITVGFIGFNTCAVYKIFFFLSFDCLTYYIYKHAYVAIRDIYVKNKSIASFNSLKLKVLCASFCALKIFI